MAYNDLNCSKLFSQPGIQRDGTVYDSDYFTDGQGVRFYKGRARKVGGCTGVDYGNNILIRNMFGFANATIVDNYLGRYNSLTHFILSPYAVTPIGSVVEINRTPTLFPSDGFDVTNINNSWSFDLYTTISDAYTDAQIIAHWAPNASDINNQISGYVYYGDINTNTPLTPITIGDAENTPLEVSGGICFVAPYLVAYDNNGNVFWNNPDHTDDPLNYWLINSADTSAIQEATISNTKIVKATPVIGASIPTVLFWSLNQLIRGTFQVVSTGTDPVVVTHVLNNNPVDNITIMAANSVVQYQQTFFWIGTDNFYMYDGVVRTIPNTMNRDWFFDNVNLQYRNKIFGVLIPRYDEIWWFYPRGDSTECNAVIIYNPKEQWWADTLSNRSAAIQANSLFPYPLMADSAGTTITTRVGPQQIYPVWQHEVGTDQILGDLIYPIKATYSHHIIDICSQQGGSNNLLRNRRFEPDFILPDNTEMTVTVTNLMFANDLNNGKAIVEGPFPFNNQTQYIDFSTQGRQTFLSFESNTIGGDFQSGKSLYDWEIGDKQD